MGDLTLGNLGVLLLRLLTLAFFTLLSVMPLILRLWRGETADDRRFVAETERDRAELDADTAIAVKRAEVRAAAEIMWAEHQLAQARLAIEAQTEIDHAQQHRRIAEALEPTLHTAHDTVEEDMYLPIAAEAEAASLAAAELPAGKEPDNLPVPVEDARANPLIPAIPDVTRAAARWIRPLVPTFVARAIDTTAQPLRTARQVFEEFEEITFSLKRTRKVTVNTSESGVRSPESTADDVSHSVETESLSLHGLRDHDSLGRRAAQAQPELTGWSGPRALDEGDGPPQLPSAE